MSNLLVICGPTATGKTDVAIKLAKKFNGELISADSRQVYKGMDIGTGKDLPANLEFRIKNYELGIKSQKYTIGYYNVQDVSLWLYDVISPDQWFSAADYCELAWVVIGDIWKRGKLPILVGGTGLYIEAVVDGIDTIGVPPNKELRISLKDKDTIYLQNKLREINPTRLDRMNNSDRNNPRRLVRAIEIQNSKFKIQNENQKNKKSFNTLILGLTCKRETLNQMIDHRVEKRIKMGVVEEIRSLLEKGYTWDLPSMSGLGYRQWKEYFEEKETKKEVEKKWKLTEHQYAKRQMTWFKKDKRIIWYDITEKDFKKQVVDEVDKYLYNLRKHG